MLFKLPIYLFNKKKVEIQPLSLNKYRTNHYREDCQLKEDFRHYVFGELQRIENKRVFNDKYGIRYSFYPKTKKQDLGNFLSVVDKYFCDALVSFGVVREDSVKYYVENSSKFIKTDSKNPRMEAEVYEV